MRKLSFYLLALLAISCRKNDRVNDGPDPGIVTEPSFLLVQVIDSIVSIPLVERTTFYYNSAGLCDSQLFEKQVSYPPATPVFSATTTRFEYNSNGLITRCYKKSLVEAEHIYAEIIYNSAGQKIRTTNYGDTHTYTYDVSGKLVRDTQFSSFGYWLNHSTYAYDAGENLTEKKTFSRYSPDSAFVISTFDNAVNPLRRQWNNLFYGPHSFSRNNLRSLRYFVNPAPIETATYQYNQQNLPVKARIQYSGQAEPTIRTYIYQ